MSLTTICFFGNFSNQNRNLICRN